MDNSRSEQYPNAGRQIGIDLAKCLAILFMVGIHCLMEFGADETNPFYYYFDLIFGSILAAPVFMTAMGIGVAYSRKSTAKQLIARGGNILVLAYLLNIVRVLPNYIIAGALNDLDLLFEAVFIHTPCGDILAFAGISLILFGVMRACKLKDYWVLTVGIVFSLAATFLPLATTDNVFLNAFSGLFTITAYNGRITMVFPLLSWFIFPCFGYWYGNRLKNSNNPNHFHLIFLLIGAVIAITGFTFESNIGFGFAYDFTAHGFYGMKIYDAVFCIGAAIGFFALCHFLSIVSSKKLQQGYITMSNALNLIYLIHWVIILWITLPLDYYGIYPPLWGCILIAIGIAIVATTLGILLKRHIKKKMTDNPNSLWRFVNAG